MNEDEYPEPTVDVPGDAGVPELPAEVKNDEVVEPDEPPTPADG